MKTAGIVVCASGYLAVNLEDGQAGYRLIESEKDLYDYLDGTGRVFIDIPVGLLDDREVRECDKMLLQKLGPDYKDSVVNPPVRRAVYAPTYGEANMVSYETMEKRIPMQAWRLSPDIRVLDSYFQQNEENKTRVFESHAELLFQILNGGNRILQKKATKKGLRHRLYLLKEKNKYVDDFFRDIKEKYRRNQVEEDKIIDAMALALFALRSSDEPMKTLPENPPQDSTGLPMAIHYV